MDREDNRCVDDCPLCDGCGSVCTTMFDLLTDEYIEIECPVKSGELTIKEARKANLADIS